MSFLLLLISGIVGFVMIGSPFFENPNTKTIYATLNLGIGSALMVSEIVKNCKEEKKKQGYKSDCVIIGSGKGPVYLAFFEASNGGYGWGYSSDR